jgi:hypothetical protein
MNYLYLSSLLAQVSAETSTSAETEIVVQQADPISLLVSLAIVIFAVVIAWKVYAKAGKPGWAVLVPVYNLIAYLQMVGRPVWWILLFLVPFVNIIIAFLLCLDLAKSFGKSAGFGVGIFFLGPIFWAILAFSDAQYQGPAAASA